MSHTQTTTPSATRTRSLGVSYRYQMCSSWGLETRAVTIIRMPMKSVRTANPPTHTGVGSLASGSFLLAEFTGNSPKQIARLSTLALKRYPSSPCGASARWIRTLEPTAVGRMKDRISTSEHKAYAPSLHKVRHPIKKVARAVFLVKMGADRFFQ
jgi:hypothetical protein